MFPKHIMPASVPVLRDLFLAGACVDKGVLAPADRAYVSQHAKVMNDLLVPVSQELAAVADDDDGIDSLPFTFANIAKRYGEVDYLKLARQDREMLVMCNIPAEDHRALSASSIEAQLAYLQYTRTQQSVGVEDSHKLSDKHSARAWSQKIEEDRPYVVSIMGSADNFHAREIVSASYVALTGPGFPQGILIDRGFLAELQQPLAAIPLGPDKRLPALVALSVEVEKNPSRRAYEWDYSQRRFLPENGGFRHFRP